eukprot:12426353-Karenia_brevis.AAC.1
MLTTCMKDSNSPGHSVGDCHSHTHERVSMGRTPRPLIGRPMDTVGASSQASPQGQAARAPRRCDNKIVRH